MEPGHSWTEGVVLEPLICLAGGGLAPPLALSLVAPVAAVGTAAEEAAAGEPVAAAGLLGTSLAARVAVVGIQPAALAPGLPDPRRL